MHKRVALSFLFLFSCKVFAEPSVKLVSRSFRPGEVFLVVVENGPSAEQIKGTFLDRSIHFFSGKDNSALAFVAIDVKDPVGPSTLDIQSAGAGSANSAFHWSQSVKVAKRYFGTRRITVDPKYVKLSEKDLALFNEQQVELHAIYSVLTPNRYINGSIIQPVPGKASGRFGQKSFFNGEPRDPHSGEDFPVSIGTPVKASAAGKVVLTKELVLSGNVVILDHGFGLFSIYAHLSRMDVKVGDEVTEGQLVGLSGVIGRATGPHLHWGMRLGQVKVDPICLLSLNLNTYLKP